MKCWKLIVVFDAATGQSVISEVTEVEGDCCGSPEDQAAREGK